MEDWKRYKLGEVALLKRGYDLPSTLREKGNYQIISSSGVTDTHNEYKVEGPGVVTGRYGTIGKVFYTDLNFWPLNTSLYVKDFNGNDPKFIYYLLQTINWQAYSTKSAVPGIDRNEVHQAIVHIPLLPEQREISSILSALDDKIELNLQMNKTLEEMAMCLYKHWFVDFGAFQEGEFVESELGMIPKGWEVKRLDEILEVRRGGSPRPIQDFISDEGLPWMKISDATVSNSPFLFSTKEFIKVEGLNKTVLIKPGSIILSNSATPGLPRLIEFDTCIHDGWLHFPQINRFNRYILYLLFLDIKEHLIQQGNGSVFTNLKTDILKSQLIRLPTLEVEISFTKQITPWFEQIKNNTIENQTLTSLRDTLLPKLISGEVRVKEAAAMLEEVM